MKKAHVSNKLYKYIVYYNNNNMPFFSEIWIRTKERMDFFERWWWCCGKQTDAAKIKKINYVVKKEKKKIVGFGLQFLNKNLGMQGEA